jgi:hypothetical protein
MKNELEWQIAFQSVGSLLVVFQNPVAEINGWHEFASPLTRGLSS